MVKKQMSETKKENKILKAVQKGVARVYSLGDKITAFAGGAMLTVMARCQVYADTTISSGEGLITTAKDWLGKILVIPAAFFLIMGFVNFASAHSEGDGPAQKKAVGQIIGGAMIGIVAAAVLLIKFDVKLDS